MKILFQGKWFTDVTEGKKFFFKPVYWAVDRGITKGHGPGTFQPYEACTRAMIVTFLKNYMGKYAIVQHQPLFPDVKKSDWFGPAVIWAYQNGITSGKGGYFKPNDPCTRGEAVTFLYNACMAS